MSTKDVLLEVLEERHRQDQKWGRQDHAAELWVLILGEEVGEACKAALAARFAGYDADEFRETHEEWRSRLAQEVRAELLQVAAVAVAWAEAVDREHEL